MSHSRCFLPRYRGAAATIALAAVLTGWMAGCAIRSSSIGDADQFPQPTESPTAFPSEDELRRSGLQPLTGTQVRRLLGRPVRYTWITPGGASGRAIISANDNIRIIWDTGAANGRLRFTATGYCNRIQDQRNQPETCYRAYSTGASELSVFKEDGTPTGRITLQTP